LAGEYQRAASAYALVRRAHPTMTSAYFGLARCLVALGQPAEAAAVLESLPPTSAHYTAAQVSVAAGILGTDDARVTTADLVRAGAALDRLGDRANTPDALLLRAHLFRVAAARAAADGAALAPLLPGATVATERGFRAAAAAALRRRARFAETPRERNALIDAANAVRPFTLW
jgi:serine/threonine-protein kinase PknG